MTNGDNQCTNCMPSQNEQLKTNCRYTCFGRCSTNQVMDNKALDRSRFSCTICLRGDVAAHHFIAARPASSSFTARSTCALCGCTIHKPLTESKHLNEANLRVRVGDICEGTVTRVEHFGLFVSVDGVPGLLRVPELSSEYIRHPSDIASVGDSVRFQIIQINDPETSPNEQFNGSIRVLTPRDYADPA